MHINRLQIAVTELLPARGIVPCWHTEFVRGWNWHAARCQRLSLTSAKCLRSRCGKRWQVLFYVCIMSDVYHIYMYSPSV